VADAVRVEIEGQLRVHRVGEGQPWLAADRRLRCAALWMGVLPTPQLHRMVWDMVCLAGIGAVEFGRKVAWAVAAQAPTLPLLIVERIAVLQLGSFGVYWQTLRCLLWCPSGCKVSSSHSSPLLHGMWCCQVAMA
jgi:hypothetical protein